MLNLQPSMPVFEPDLPFDPGMMPLKFCDDKWNVISGSLQVTTEKFKSSEAFSIV